MAPAMSAHPHTERRGSDLSESRSADINNRLSLPFVARLPLAATVGTFSGFVLGLAKGSQDSGLRFQAENAHRLPTTQTGWYLYHKSKNYNMMLGGILEGFRNAGRVGVWVGCYFLVEEGVDRGRASMVRVWRDVFQAHEYVKGRREEAEVDGDEDVVAEKRIAGNRDCASSTLAGLGTAGLFSALNRFPLPTAVRTAKMGAKAGLAFGISQDALSLLRGRRVGYVEFIKRHTLGRPANAMPDSGHILDTGAKT